MPANDDLGQACPRPGTRTGPQGKGNHCRHQHECGHEDRPQAGVVSLENGGIAGHASPAQVVGFVHLEDAVFLHDANEHEQAEHGVEIHRLAKQQQGK